MRGSRGSTLPPLESVVVGQPECEHGAQYEEQEHRDTEQRTDCDEPNLAKDNEGKILIAHN